MIGIFCELEDYAKKNKMRRCESAISSVLDVVMQEVADMEASASNVVRLSDFRNPVVTPYIESIVTVWNDNSGLGSGPTNRPLK